MKLRIFIAIELSAQLCSCLSQVQQDLQTLCPVGVRWVKPEMVHLTIKFIGDYPQAQLARVQECMVQSAQEVAPFELKVQGCGAFPKPSFARVIWLGVALHPHLVKLHQRLEKALAPLGIEPEKRAYHPHLTLGRVKDARQLTRLPEFLQTHADTLWGSMQVNEYILFQSDLRPTGAVYTPLQRVALKSG